MGASALREVALWVLFLWLVFDGFVVFRRRGEGARRGDRFSMPAIVLANWIGIGGAIALGFNGVGPLGPHALALQVFGLLLLFAGIVVRSVAIAQLGRFHAPDVAIQVGHRVVDTGLYRHVRHPSYLGASIALLGFGLALGSWASTVAVAGMALLAYAYRIHVEEQALVASLGEAYADYRKRTSRLIPGLY
jgi:protein-S-isoprenylcysteine O-methyltransferase